MPGPTAGYVLRPGEAELRWMEKLSTAFLATGEQTGGAFCLVDERAEKGTSVPLHRHREDMESFYVLEGELMLFVGDEPGVLAPPGSFAHVPGGVVHGFRVETDAARYLILTTPRHGEFYRAITLASQGSVEGAQIRAAAQEYGIEYVGPLPDDAR